MRVLSSLKRNMFSFRFSVLHELTNQGNAFCIWPRPPRKPGTCWTCFGQVAPAPHLTSLPKSASSQLWCIYLAWNSLYISNEARLVIVGTKRCTGIFAFLVFLGISASSIICSPTRCDFSRRMVSIPATNQQYQLVILRQSYVAVIHRIICWTAWLKKLLIKDLYILELM